MPIELAVVIPTYNERENVAPLLALLEQALARTEWEAIFVDDNSPDGTSEFIRGLAANNRRVRVLERIGRRGLSSACIEGMLATAAQYIAVMDADLQHDESILPKMLERMKSENLDIVVASRKIEGGSMREFPRARVWLSTLGSRISRWVSHSDMFSPAVGIAFAKRPDALPEGFLEDRAKFSGRNIDPAAMMAAVPYLLDQLRAHFHWLDQTMADGRLFLQGAAAGLADLAAYHPVWFLQRNFGPTAAPLGGFPRPLAWAERVAAIGHGDRRPMTSQGALAVASAATSSTGTVADRDDPIGRQPGQRVTVTPDDTGRDPVVGELVASGVDEITISEQRPRCW